MNQLAILEGENLGATGLRKLARQTRNVAKQTGRATAQAAKSTAKFVNRQILNRAKALINSNVRKLIGKYISSDKLQKTGTASLAASIQPLIQTPIISALALIPGAQPLIPTAPALISAATYKAIDELKKTAMKKTRLSGEVKQGLEKSDITALVAAGIIATAILRGKK